MNVNLAICVMVIYILFNIIETKYIAKEEINTKKLTKQSLLVASSTLAAEYLMSKITPDVVTTLPTKAFTSEPAF
tara:strand:+ start:234 stop:458 length:225 start_codon:yes stop_codon:yes gene_type:complete